ncbi:FERM domain-containing protein 4A-like isoform X3 [Centruroides vittatus]|uniref:FERM domain-containing protein 4A-like isoform X3 n=1 Tax=Centruroides vittatus TaxID=120091 RepID=UPI00350EA3F2
MVGCLEFCKMTEGRHCQVVLLDERRLEILVKPKLYAGDLLDMVASHFSIKEKEYFGLAFVDDTGHFNWLQLNRRVLEHELPKKVTQNSFVLHFLVKYFVESITQLRDVATVEAFYLQAQLLIFNGTIEVDSDTSFHLAALVLQATHGDYVDEKTTKEQLKKLPVLPTNVLKEHPSLPVCEEQIIGHYCKISGQSRGIAIVNYMTVVESLPTYGVHYFEVKDKTGMPWWLGISFKGISQYDHSDRKIPRKMFLWKQLENLYFRDRKFSIEVHDAQRLPANRRTFGPGNVTVYVWFTISPILTKSIWSMAVSQHQFYLDRKHGKTLPPVARNLGDIASELSRSAHSISSSSGSHTNLSLSASSHSLPALKLEGDVNEDTRAAYEEVMKTLKLQKENLEETLYKKLEELKFLCFKEGELIGELPPETPIELFGESLNTGYTVDDMLLKQKSENKDDEIAKLEIDCEIQRKLTKAVFRLTNDSKASKTIRRQRKLSYQQSQAKLKQIENQLSVMKKQNEVKEQEVSSSEEQNKTFLSQIINEDDPVFKEHGVNLSNIYVDTSPGMKESCSLDNQNPLTSASFLSSYVTPGSNSAPPSPTKYRHHTTRSSSSRPSTPSSTNSGRAWNQALNGQGYTPNSVYQTSYRNQQYPILSSYSTGSDSNSGSALSLKSPYQNRFESTLNIEGSNLYSVPTQRTSQAFDSQDDILANFPSKTEEPNFGLISRHNSLDSSRRHSYKHLHQLNDSSDDKNQTKSTYEKHMSYTMGENLGKCNHHQTSHQHYHSSLHCVHHHYYHHHHHHINHLPLSAEKNLYSLNKMEQTTIPQTSTKSMYLSTSHHQYNHMCHTGLMTQHATINAMVESYVPNIPKASKASNVATSPRNKVKTWTETSLDSPIPSHKPETSAFGFKNHQLNPETSIFLQLPAESNLQEKMWTGNNFDKKFNLHSSFGQRQTNIISPGHFQPYWEETKPYEISDFYKYSVKHRKSLQQNQEKAEDSSPQDKKHNASVNVENATACASLYRENPPKSNPPEDGYFEEKLETSIADGFHEEMIAWYQDQENINKATLV